MVIITPKDVTDYTSSEEVLNRPIVKLQNDILQGSNEIFRRVGHRFTDITKYPVTLEGRIQVSPEVTLAFIKAAEYFALKNSEASLMKGYSSEKIGDYSYTVGTKSGSVEFPWDDISPLLEGHFLTRKGGTFFRMRGI